MSLPARLLALLLVVGALGQIVVLSARIATSLRVVDLGLPLTIIGILSTCFALLPVFASLAIGRFNDRGGARHALAGGSVLMAAAILGLWQSASITGLLGFTILLGFGQALVITALQLLASVTFSAERRDSAVAWLMTAMSLGQAIAPLLLSYASEHAGPSAAAAGGGTADVIFLIDVVAVFALLAAATMFALWAPPAAMMHKSEPAPLSLIFRDTALLRVTLAGAMCVAAADLLLVFFPPIALDRGVDPFWIGVLLSVRAAASMVSRFFFTRLASWLGQRGLFTIALLSAGGAMSCLAAPLPMLPTGVLMLLCGFGLGVALTASVLMTLSLAPAHMQGSALSFRFTANRVAQFLIPLGAGLVASALGASSIFLILGIATGAVAWRLPAASRAPGKVE